MIDFLRLLTEVIRNLAVIGVISYLSIQYFYSSKAPINERPFQDLPDVVIFEQNLEPQKTKVEKVQVNQENYDSEFQNIYIRLAEVEKLPSHEKYLALKGMLVDLEQVHQKYGAVIDGHETVMEDIQRRVYWTHKFMSINQLNSNDVVVAPVELKNEMPLSNMPSEKKKRKLKKVM